MRGKAIDLTGTRYGRLTAVSLAERNKFGVRCWLWQCDCGKQIARPAQPIRDGRQVSCGCHRDEQSRQRAKHGKSSTRTYRAWIAMKARCSGPRDRPHYADRGITVCRRWKKSFEAFLADMGECPPGLTLDRIDNNRSYQPGNCRWATQQAQIRNTRRSVLVSVDGRRVCLKEACEALSINYDRVRSRIRLGSTPQRAIAVDWTPNTK